jgi:hypothetical protein
MSDEELIEFCSWLLMTALVIVVMKAMLEM